MRRNLKHPGHPNIPFQNHDYVNSTPEEQIFNIKAELVTLKSFIVEQIYILKKHFEQKEILPENNNLLKLLEGEISYLREEYKVKSEIITMLSDKQNTYRCLHTNTTDTAVSEKPTIDQDTIPTKPIKTTGTWTNMDISNNKRGHASRDGNSLIISQLHHPSKEIKPKRIKENQSREIWDKTKELKNLDHNHKYKNTANKKAVAIIGDSTLNYIDQHGLSNEPFKVRVKKYSGATTEDICDHLKPEIRKKPDVVIINAGTNNLTNNSKSLENCV